MLAMQVEKHGSPPTLREIDRPQASSGEVRLKIHCAGVNFADLLIVEGTYQAKPAIPFTLGMEVCGTVDQLGQSVGSLSIGQRVAAYSSHGAFAEYGCYPAHQCVPVPDQMPSEVAAGFLIAYGTSHAALDCRAQLKPGERLLVLGAAGGIGLTAVEIGKIMGAEVIAAARGTEKLAAAKRAGADHLIDTNGESIRDKVKAFGGADVVYDPVGGDSFKAALRATNSGGRLIPLGFASGEIPQIPANILLVKNLTVLGFFWGGYAELDSRSITTSIETLMGWYCDGVINPQVGKTVALSETGQALEMLRQRKVVGKIVVNID